MISSITFNKTYIVEPWFHSDNPKAIVKKFKLKPHDRGYKVDDPYERVIQIPLFKKGLSISFKENLNIIVGSNGCGKTELFKILKHKLNNTAHKYNLNNVIIEQKENVNSLNINFETDALKNLVKPNPESKNFLTDTVLVMDSSEKSHGENTKILLSLLKDKKNQVLFLDEPDTGLDIPSQFKLCKEIKELSKNNQVFLITHNKTIIDYFGEVYDLDSLKWVSSSNLFKNYEKNLL